MVNLICKILFIFLFSNLLAAPVITVISPLTFPSKSAQTTENIVVAPNDSGAAVLRVTGGTPNTSVFCSLGKNSTTIATPPGSSNAQKLTVNNWKISCPGIFDATGTMEVRIGATAVKKSADVAGNYTESTQSLIINF